MLGRLLNAGLALANARAAKRPTFAASGETLYDLPTDTCDHDSAMLASEHWPRQVIAIHYGMSQHHYVNEGNAWIG